MSRAGRGRRAKRNGTNEWMCCKALGFMCHIRTVGTGQETGSPHLYVRGGKDSNNDMYAWWRPPGTPRSARRPEVPNDRKKTYSLGAGAFLSQISLTSVSYLYGPGITPQTITHSPNHLSMVLAYRSSPSNFHISHTGAE